MGIVLSHNQKLLSGLEDKVVEGFASAARALRRIKESKIYKEQYGTWENYLKERWGYTPDWWVKLQSASNVMRNLKSNTNGIGLPTSERQGRELAPLDSIEQVQVWTEVTNRYQLTEITAQKIKEVKEEILTPEVEVIDTPDPSTKEIEKRFDIMADTRIEEIEMMQVVYKKAIELRAGKKYIDWLGDFIIYKIESL